MGQLQARNFPTLYVSMPVAQNALGQSATFRVHSGRRLWYRLFFSEDQKIFQFLQIFV